MRYTLIHTLEILILSTKMKGIKYMQMPCPLSSSKPGSVTPLPLYSTDQSLYSTDIKETVTNLKV